MPLRTIAILQCRIRSSRLPAKAMLTLAGYPLVTMAALRASNRGLPLLVATSDREEDDPIVEEMRRRDFQCFRGSLNDVLGRFTKATADLSPEDVVIRLTADNVFPDGDLLREVIDQMDGGRNRFIAMDSSAGFFPYGLSVEAFSVKLLRQAEHYATTAYDREHVTPWIRRQFPSPQIRISIYQKAWANCRCSIDNLKDYERISRLFRGIQNPVEEPWYMLCDKLTKTEPKIHVPQRRVGDFQSSQSAITLGTAQIGLPGYGRNNISRRLTKVAAIDLLQNAMDAGVTCLDSARAYGDSEKIIGEAIKPYGDSCRVITKLDPLATLQKDASVSEVRSAVDASVFRSCRELGAVRLGTFLLHRWEHRRSHRGAIWGRLCELKHEGVLGSLGASVQTPAEAIEAARDTNVNHIQLPFNIIDHRWHDSGVDEIARERRELIVHVRSVFLQGVLLASPCVWPVLTNTAAKKIVSQLDSTARALGRAGRIDLCMAYVLGQKWIHSLVLGVESKEQLREILALSRRSPLKAEEIESVQKIFRGMPEKLLNPSDWEKGKGD